MLVKVNACAGTGGPTSRGVPTINIRVSYSALLDDPDDRVGVNKIKALVRHSKSRSMRRSCPCTPRGDKKIFMQGCST